MLRKFTFQALCYEAFSYCVCSFCTTEPANFCLLLFSAIATVVTVAEILKNNGLAVEKSESCLYKEV